MKEFLQLVGGVILLAKIQCEKCGLESSAEVDDHSESLEIFYEDGWRKKRSKILCPHCVKSKK